MTMKRLFEVIIEDFKHYSEDRSNSNYLMIFLYFQGLQGLLIYRILHFLFLNSNNYFYKIFYKILFLVLYIPFKNITGLELHPEAKIGSKLYLPHGQSVVISKKAILGSSVTLHHNCTIGINYKTELSPNIGNNVFIGTNSSIIGGVSIGKDSTVLSNTTVIKSFPDNSVIGGVPGKLVKTSDRI